MHFTYTPFAIHFGTEKYINIKIERSTCGAIICKYFKMVSSFVTIPFIIYICIGFYTAIAGKIKLYFLEMFSLLNYDMCCVRHDHLKFVLLLCFSMATNFDNSESEFFIRKLKKR